MLKEFRFFKPDAVPGKDIRKSVGFAPDIIDRDGDGMIYDGTEFERPATEHSDQYPDLLSIDPAVADQWFVDLDGYPGPLSDLQMVQGADKLLDVLADGKREVSILVSTEKFTGAMKLSYIHGSGTGFYECDYPNAPKSIWLCKVVEFVFRHYPSVIYWKLKEPKQMALNQYDLAQAIFDIDGYFIPRPNESKSKAFERAKAEFVRAIQKRIDAVESISFERWDSLKL